jgi:hypothetical protein
MFATLQLALKQEVPDLTAFTERFNNYSGVLSFPGLQGKR